MTPDLIAQAIALPLPVRLALLDADPTGAGWLVHAAGRNELLPRPPVQSWTFPEGARGAVGEGFAWLPCNPLAIVEHAARLFLPDAHWFAYLSTETPEHGPYRARIEDFSRSPQLRAEGECPYTAAIALLREVVGG